MLCVCVCTKCSRRGFPRSQTCTPRSSLEHGESAVARQPDGWAIYREQKSNHTIYFYLTSLSRLSGRRPKRQKSPVLATTATNRQNNQNKRLTPPWLLNTTPRPPGQANQAHLYLVLGKRLQGRNRLPPVRPRRGVHELRPEVNSNAAAHVNRNGREIGTCGGENTVGGRDLAFSGCRRVRAGGYVLRRKNWKGAADIVPHTGVCFWHPYASGRIVSV